jgi:hypothetical protein
MKDHKKYSLRFWETILLKLYTKSSDRKLFVMSYFILQN